MAGRIVCVSNRVSLPRKAAAPGGLAVGVLGALKHSGGMWFGWGGELTDEAPGKPAIQMRDGVAYALLKLRRKEFNHYYNGFSNDALWPLFHYMPSKFRYRAEDHEAYEKVNRRFAQKLVPLLNPGDVLWVHDYHLIPLARYLREAGVHAPIGFFLHIPFPYIEILRVLPNYAELIRDLASYDVVGFQTESDLASFHSCVARVFGAASLARAPRMRVGNRTVHTGVFPIGIDVAAIAAEAQRACGGEVVKRMVDSLVGRKLMIGVDRLDYSKGLVERFAAYEQFLETFADHRSRISYMQIAPVSRKDVQAYKEIRRSLEQAAGRTNGRFADTDWTPIRYLNRNFPHETLMGFLRAAQVGLVTPLRDGMNLVAKEYVAAQDPADPGVLVLSSLAGAAQELDAALLVNPHDELGVVNAIQGALMMPLSERRARHAALLAKVQENDIRAWTDRYVAMLRSVANA